jgi:hypothetical protein
MSIAIRFLAQLKKLLSLALLSVVSFETLSLFSVKSLPLSISQTQRIACFNSFALFNFQGPRSFSLQHFFARKSCECEKRFLALAKNLSLFLIVFASALFR